MCCASYGEGSGAILLDDVACTGSEVTLLSCHSRASRKQNIYYDHYEDAAVICCELLYRSSHDIRKFEHRLFFNA